MILLLIVAASPVRSDDASRRGDRYCALSESGQPLRFCLADRRHDRAEADLAAVLVKARRAAQDQRREIARFSKGNGGVTFGGDPVTALNTAQKSWDASYKADCSIFALSRATGNAGTEGVTADLGCRADRLAERGRFLKTIYHIGD